MAKQKAIDDDYLEDFKDHPEQLLHLDLTKDEAKWLLRYLNKHEKNQKPINRWYAQEGPHPCNPHGMCWIAGGMSYVWFKGAQGKRFGKVALSVMKKVFDLTNEYLVKEGEGKKCPEI